MANTLYKTTVRELEAVLPPRVVSQSLQEGLSAVNKNADTLSYRDAESILQNRVLPRLTLSLGAARAETARREILERLSKLPDESQLPALDLGAQGRMLRELREALGPFNIYFDWSETQKLRAQLLLLETEHAAERNAGALVAAAQAQLGVLRQKLDAALSVQAHELTVLEVALQDSTALKSPKVRRLGLLLELIRRTQEARKLAPAEVERAHQLAGDLRAERAQLLSEEARELRALEEGFSTLLTLEPTLAEELSTYRQEAAETLLGRSLAAFRSTLETAHETLRRELQQDFQESADAHQPSPELAQLLTLSLTILETTLPPAADVQRVRYLLRTGAVGTDHSAHHLEAEEGYRDQPGEPGQEPGAFLTATQKTPEHSNRLSDLTRVQGVVPGTQVARARRMESFADRVAAAESAAAPLRALTSEAAADLRSRVQLLSAQGGPLERVSPERQAELEATLHETEALIASLQKEADVTRSVAAQLIQENALDDIFGFFGVPAPDSAAPPPAPAAVVGTNLQSWLERQVAHEGVDGLALFSGADTLVAGHLPTDVTTLRRAIDLTKTRTDTLRANLADLKQGDATTLNVEAPEPTLVTCWLSRTHSLVLVTRVQGGAARQRLEDALPELVTLLA